MDQEALDLYIANAVEQCPIEAKIIKRVFNALKRAGTPVISVWDGEEDTPVTDLASVYRQAFNLDECHLYTKGGGWVYLVMGQDWDTLTDYTLSLDDALKPVNDWIMKNF
jgi:hypothetical protein